MRMMDLAFLNFKNGFKNYLSLVISLAFTILVLFNFQNIIYSGAFEVLGTRNKEYIDIIIQSTKGLSRMTGNILQLSHLENQSIICEKELFRIDEQIRQSILRMEPVWSAKNLLISPDLDRITWYGNQELTAHIWNNLLDNAVKFTPQGGDILITAHIAGEWLSVTFQDSGIGMTPEIQAHIFDKFYQGDTSHKKKGNGLGLALVRKIVTLHGGSIHVESHPNLGSSFKLLLPLEPSP